MKNKQALIERILFATDFSSCADHAEHYVGRLAETYRSTVEVLHILEIYEGLYVTTIQDHRETDGRLAAVARRLQRPAVHVLHQQKAGIPDVLICERAMEIDADLIVLGTHGRTGLRHVLLGSTAERVLTMAPCPVMVIRMPGGTDEPHAATPIQFTQMLVPIDFSVCSLDALEYGIQFAKDCGESLTLLHILEPIAYSVDLMLTQTWEQNRNEVDAHMNALVNHVGAHGVSVRGMILGGLPADSILETVRAIDADLIVMGTHGRRGISHVIQGSVAEAVLRRAPCPVLAMKNLAFAPDHQRVIPTMRPIVRRSEYGPSPEKRSG